ncbi:MAG: CDP-diacylglycerol O-phosphatidyltransferase [Alphaproteobacteria bacterium]|nr:CDP-diacylglycerol O-phosphatidyltransferase [Alphaproteobacteria bacterium]
MRPPRTPRPRRGIPLRTIVPNAVTALALCSGLFGIRYGIDGEWRNAAAAIALAAVLDGLDGRIARLLNGASRFGAELDSLSDVTAFGVAPALIIYQWVLQPLEPGELHSFWTGWGWLFVLAYAACAALRLARFNANIDADDQPHKSAGYLTGVPAPAGAGLLFLPLFLSLATENDAFRQPWLVAPWAALVAFLMISNLATFSWGSVRLRSHVRLGALALIVVVGAALLQKPWPTLSVAALLYAALIPLSIYSYAKVKRQRAAAASRAPTPDPAAPSL